MSNHFSFRGCEVDVVREIFKNNPWVSGLADFNMGDLMALKDPEEFNPTKVRSLKKLYELLKSYDGIFIYKNLVFVNSYSYGTFVYKLPNLKDYVEHLTIDAMDFKRFRLIVKELLYS